MKHAFRLLRIIGLYRSELDDRDLSPFDRRLKQVYRARIVNAQGLGGPVFRNRPSRREA